MPTPTPNYGLNKNVFSDDTFNEAIEDNQNGNMDKIDTRMKTNADGIATLVQQINAITTTPAPTEQEIQIARNGYVTLLTSILNGGIKRYTVDPDVNSDGSTFWYNSTNGKIWFLTDETLGAKVWVEIAKDTDLVNLENQINNTLVPSIQNNANEIINIKMELTKNNIINFANKTGAGFYDFFDTEDNVDTINTTATYDGANDKYTFDNTFTQELIMKEQDFSSLSLLPLDNTISTNVYPDSINKLTVKSDVLSSTTVEIDEADRPPIATDKLWIDGQSNEITNVVTDNVAYDRTTPVQVVGSAYITNKNARPQRLDNGWLIAGVLDASPGFINFYKSEDNGATFTFLQKTDSTGSTFAFESDGTQIFGLLAHPSTFAVRSFSFDVTTVSSDIVCSIIEIQTAMGNCSLIKNSAGTELHATWASKNATYPNSFNIRYANGTINPITKAVTWGSVEQRTILNTSGQDYKEPSITVDSSNYSHIAAAHDEGTTYKIVSIDYNGATWTIHTVFSGGTHIQSSPDAITLKNGANAGRIVVAWYGFDAIDTVRNNIRLKYSDDVGVTWVDFGVTNEKLTSGNTYAQAFQSICEDKNGDVFCVWLAQSVADPTHFNARFSKHTTSWSTEEILTTNTTASITKPSTLNNYDDFEKPITIWGNDEATNVEFYGKWTDVGGYTLTMTDAVTVLENDELPLIDIKVFNGATENTLVGIDDEKFYFQQQNTGSKQVNLKILGKDIGVDAIAYNLI